MRATYDLIVRNGTVVNHAGTGKADIGIRDGRIVAIGALGSASAGETFDATGLHVLPGVIDTQVHFREPGNEHKEDLETGSRAAVLGGVTAVFEMPNTSPPTTNAEALLDKLTRAKGRMFCDHAFYVGGTHENAGLLSDLERIPGCAGVKTFVGSSTGNLLVADDEGVLAVLRNGRRRCSFHAEDEPRLRERKHLAESGKPETHPLWRDATAALLATQRIVGLARQAHRRIHILHVSTKEEIEFLADHKDIATVETTPNHLTLVAPDCYRELGTYAQMNPPVRDAAHRDGIWAGIANGVVDVLGSDHAPHTRAEKDKTYPDTPSGMPGVQTLVPLMLDHVNAGRLTLERFVDLVCHGQQRAFGIAGKGRMAAGWDADLTIVDLKAKRTIDNKWIASRCGWTPFHGKTVAGWPKATIVRGRIVMRDDEVQGMAHGAPIRFQETLTN